MGSRPRAMLGRTRGLVRIATKQAVNSLVAGKVSARAECSISSVHMAVASRRWVPLAAAPSRSFATPSISAQAVKQLRDKTGSPMMDCKRALEESNGDESAALDYLRKKGMASAAKKESRRSADGLVAMHITQDGTCGTLIELNSETDFVAKNPVFQKLAVDIATLRAKTTADVDIEKFKSDFKLSHGPKSSGEVAVGEAVKEMVATVGENCQLRKAVAISVDDAGVIGSYMHTPMGEGVGKLGALVALSLRSGSMDKSDALREAATKVAMHIAAASPQFLSKDHISKADEDREKAIVIAQAVESGKKPEHAEKMVAGRMGKWMKEVVLTEQEFLISGDGDKKQSVSQYLEEVSKSLGAKIAISGFVRVKCGESV